MIEPAGLEGFVAAHQRSLQRAGWLLTGHWEAAEDLAQGALIATWQHWDDVGTDTQRLAYARTSLFRLFLREHRRRWRGERPVTQVPETAAPTDTTDTTDTRVAVAAVLARLTPRQRAVLTARFLLDLTEADTAAALGCSVGTVKSHSARAVAELRRNPDLHALIERQVQP